MQLLGLLLTVLPEEEKMSASMFTGVSAFPLTPFRNDQVDEKAFAGLVRRLAVSGVDSITALGSTGSYPYMTTQERARVARLAVQNAGSVAVFVGIGALRTSQVLALARGAEEAGASGLLLSAMTYQSLTPDEVFELFRTVTESTELPVIVYDNPGTTHFHFTTELYARIAELPGIASIKIPGVPADPDEARRHVASIRAVIPERVTIGVSGDAFGAAGLIAGCDAWYTVIGGTIPGPALGIARAVREGRVEDARAECEQLTPLWKLFADLGGSARVTAAIAEYLGLVGPSCLPLPLRGMSAENRARVAAMVEALGLQPGPEA